MNTSYTLSIDNRITGVGGAWDEFASENDALSAVAKKVVGSTIFEFVSGFETQSYLNAVFFAVRSKEIAFDTTYRCDGQNEKRLFRMLVTPLSNGRLRVDHTLLASGLFPAPPSVTPISRRVCESRCSVCCSFKVGDEWIDPFNEPDVRFFPKSYRVCPSCKSKAWVGINEKRHANVVRLAV